MRNAGLQFYAQFRSIINWGFAGMVMVGLPAYFVVGDDGVMTFMTVGFVSFMVIRVFLIGCEFRDAKDGF